MDRMLLWWLTLSDTGQRIIAIGAWVILALLAWAMWQGYHLPTRPPGPII